MVFGYTFKQIPPITRTYVGGSSLVTMISENLLVSPQILEVVTAKDLQNPVVSDLRPLNSHQRADEPAIAGSSHNIAMLDPLKRVEAVYP